MNIAMNFASVRTHGMRSYFHGFLPAVLKLLENERVLIISPVSEAAMVRHGANKNGQVTFRGFHGSLLWRVLWEQFVLPRILKTWRADVLFSPFDIAPIGFSPTVLAIRNPSPLLLSMGALKADPSAMAKARMHKIVSSLSCKRARIVFYPTAFAARELGDIAKVPQVKRQVVHHGVDCEYWARVDPGETAAVHAKYGVSNRNFFLFVSNLYSYKHPEVLVDAFALMLKQVESNLSAKVLVVGGLTDGGVVRVVKSRINGEGLSQRIAVTGSVPRSDLVHLYQTCCAMVLPTTMETFGQPFVEAMAAGAAVVCADLPFAREICGDAAMYFPPMDVEALAGIMMRCLRNETSVNEQRVACRSRAVMFSWDREARETLELLRSATLPMALT